MVVPQLPDLTTLSHEQKDALIVALWEQVLSLTARLTALEQKLNEPPKTPDNSSVPPSKGQKANRSDTAVNAGLIPGQRSGAKPGHHRNRQSRHRRDHHRIIRNSRRHAKGPDRGPLHVAVPDPLAWFYSAMLAWNHTGVDTPRRPTRTGCS